MKFRRSLLTTPVLFAAAILVPVAVNAQSTRAQEMMTQTQDRNETVQLEQQEGGREMQAQSRVRQVEAKGRLEAAKLKACQNRQDTIVNILNRLSNRGEKQLEVFTKISDRTQVFYTEQGNMLDTYDSLVADVVAKRATAEGVVANLSNTAQEFDCEGEDPKGVVSSFKEQLKARNVVLKEYRTAIKNLIVGVKSAQSAEVTADTQEGSQE